MNKTDEPYDLVVFGASSFVGKIIIRYLFTHNEATKELKWAIAGRNKAKLTEVKNSLGATANHLPIIVADAADKHKLKTLCRQTKVVISTVGPYALYGEPLLQQCVQTGTDYLDLTGEPQWILQMLDKYQAQAEQSGARIVNCCGFDSVPSDLGVYYLQQQSQQKYAEPCKQIKMRVKALKGSASGGTVASIINLVKQASTDAQLRKVLANPYALCPAHHDFTCRQHNHKIARFEKDSQAWVAPFIMAAINERIVHRSNALLGNQYGDKFRYDEAMLTGKSLQGRIQGWALTMGLGAFITSAAIPPVRWALEKYLLPKPGQGPSEQAQAKGFYDLRFYGTTTSGKKLVGKVTGDRDPGYGSTAKIIAEAAICLAIDMNKEEKSGGFWTPAAIFADRLIKRLEDNAGLSFSILD